MKKTVTRILSSVLFMILAVFMLVGTNAANITTTVITNNAAPVAENIEFTTYRNVAFTERFRSADPEGDNITYTVTAEPKKGKVEINGDSFTYTPYKDKKGKDSFAYTAADSTGNISNEAVVTIFIKKQITSVAYSDMNGNPSLYNALKLAEKGVLTGEQIGDIYIFDPDSGISRGEFLALCMELNGMDLLKDVKATGFFDDEEIPVWEKPYIATALMTDIVSGYTRDGETVFAANSPVTYAEASVMLNNTLGITDVKVEDTSAWAYQAMANLTSCNIIPDTINETDLYSSYITRADAADMLASALDVIETRKSPHTGFDSFK